MRWTKEITFIIFENDIDDDVWICEPCGEQYEQALDAIQCECEDEEDE